MEKTEFIRLIEIIIAFDDQRREFGKAIEKISDGFCIVELGNDICHELIKQISKQFDDKDDWIQWWLYETNYGEDARYTEVEFKGIKRNITTSSDLYDLLVEFNEK